VTLSHYMERTPRILLLEDDPNQAESLVEEVILKVFPDADVRYYDSEHSFFDALEHGEIVEWQPQFAIIDLLIHQYSVDDLGEMSESPDFHNLDSARQAGIRCRDALRKVCPSVKVALVTVLNERPEGLVIQKGIEHNEKLTEFLKQATG
jgi:hypothetical protein